MKVEFFPNIYNKRHFSFSSNIETKIKTEQPKDSFKKEDVQYNFTYNNVSSSVLNSKSILKVNRNM